MDFELDFPVRVNIQDRNGGDKNDLKCKIRDGAFNGGCTANFVDVDIDCHSSCPLAEEIGINRDAMRFHGHGHPGLSA